MDDVMHARKPKQLNVAAQLIEAQPTCSLGLGYKRRVGIPVAGQWTHTHGAYKAAVGVLNIHVIVLTHNVPVYIATRK